MCASLTFENLWNLEIYKKPSDNILRVANSIAGPGTSIGKNGLGRTRSRTKKSLVACGEREPGPARCRGRIRAPKQRD